MRVSSRWFVAVLACLAVVVVLAAYKYFQIRAEIAYGNSFPEPSESVEATTAEVKAFEKSFSTIGEIVSPQALELRNEVEGRISAVNFSSGDRVARGDILVQLDVSEEKARLDAAKARAELAKLELERARQLASRKSVSEETVDRAESGYDVAIADTRALEAIIDKKTIRAPFDAVAGIHSLDEGEYLQSNTLIVSLVGVNDYTWVDFNMPQDKADVPPGTEVTVIPPGRDRSPVNATIIAREVSASASSRNLRLRARIDNPPGLPPNVSVKVVVPLGIEERIQLPRTALLMDNRGDYVFVLNGGGDGKAFRAERRPVEVADKNAEVVSLESGLEPGELVAVHGAFKLSPDMLTHVRTREDVAGNDGE